MFASVFGGWIRRLSGFGGALIMSPLLMWVFPLPFLIPIVMSAEIFGGILLSRHWKVHSDDRPRLWRMLFFAGVLLPLGLWLGSFAPIWLIKAFTSVLVLLFASYLLLRPHFRIAISKLFDGFAGGLSGLLLGSCGIGGPPAALYLNATDHPFERTRALLSQFISGISVCAIVAASLIGGSVGWLTYLFAAIPAYWVGMEMASYLLKRHDLSHEAIRRLCLILLIGNSGFNLLLLLISKSL
nr:sulfite exporter TauE/SafE family protein [Polynucleobacter antarcticus]